MEKCANRAGRGVAHDSVPRIVCRGVRSRLSDCLDPPLSWLRITPSLLSLSGSQSLRRILPMLLRVRVPVGSPPDSGLSVRSTLTIVQKTGPPTPRGRGMKRLAQREGRGPGYERRKRDKVPPKNSPPSPSRPAAFNHPVAAAAAPPIDAIFHPLLAPRPRYYLPLCNKLTVRRLGVGTREHNCPNFFRVMLTTCYQYLNEIKYIFYFIIFSEVCNNVIQDV